MSNSSGVLPNNGTENDSAWSVDVHMKCATNPTGDGCDCNVTSHASNPLSGNNANERSNSDPNGLNLRVGYDDSLTLSDYEEHFKFAPQDGLCYLPPVAPPRPGCEPVFEYAGLARGSVLGNIATDSDNMLYYYTQSAQYTAG